MSKTYLEEQRDKKVEALTKRVITDLPNGNIRVKTYVDGQLKLVTDMPKTIQVRIWDYGDPADGEVSDV
jgi:hypothetical protein